MEKQTSKSKIYNMFNGRELTQDCDGNWYLTELYPSPSIPIDSVLCDEIVHIYNYLEEDSGNSFTGEIHYTLQDTINLENIPYNGPIDILNREYRKVILLRLEHENSG